MTTSSKKPNQVLMTGNPDRENVYMPDMGKEDADEGGGSAALPGTFQEDRDF
jgi:hypothetical protein